MTSKIFRIPSKPGFGRDGTVLDRDFYVDGQWCRFQRGRPKKIGGYKEIDPTLTGIQRGSFVFMSDTIVYLYSWSGNTCSLTKTTQNVPTATHSEATMPTLNAADEYSFQSDAIYDALGTSSIVILAHGAKNLEDIANTTNTPISMSVLGTDPPSFSNITDGNGNDISVSGGVVVLQPFVFAYGNNGLIKNSNANKPNDWRTDQGGAANEVNVAATKIVKGLPLRGGGASPSGLFWSLDSLIKVSYASGNNFRYDTISTQTSILSPSSVIEYDGVYFWVGVDRFLCFDGSVNEVPNIQNLNWFFDNVNFAQRSKVWACKVPRFGEIWWFFPFGSATECTHAIIYNVREKIWYDIELARSAGFYSQVFHYPVMYGAEENMNGAYSVFAHEYSSDAIINNDQIAIPSWFETSGIDLSDGSVVGNDSETTNAWTRLERLEPDFILTGTLNLTVKGNKYAQSSVITTDGPYPILPDTEKVDLRLQRRNMRLRFESNELHGKYEMGRLKLHIESGDNRS